MRRVRLLVAGLGALILGAGAAGAGAAEEQFSSEGLVSLDSTGDGATVIVTGWLSQERFEVKEVSIAGSRPAGRSTDPDQFRVTMLDIEGRELGTVQMWSPLLSLEWDAEGQKESVQGVGEREVSILIPVSMTLSELVFNWPEGKYELGRIKVRSEVERFCKEMPDNPACRRD